MVSYISYGFGLDLGLQASNLIKLAYSGFWLISGRALKAQARSKFLFGPDSKLRPDSSSAHIKLGPKLTSELRAGPVQLTVLTLT